MVKRQSYVPKLEPLVSFRMPKELRELLIAEAARAETTLSASSPRKKSRRLASISHRTTPLEKMSARRVTSFPRSCSGAI